MTARGAALWLGLSGLLVACDGFPEVPACADDEACGAGYRCDRPTGRCVALPDARPPDAEVPAPDAAPTPVDAAGAQPDAAPILMDAAPTQPDTTPPPADAAPTPVDATDTPADAGATPADAALPDIGPDACIPAPEICNGLDEDCDGRIDEEAAGVGSACELDGLGPCAIGRRTCTGAEGLVCTPTATPEDEVCDGIDNDCDGVTDGLVEDCYEGPDGTAGVGACVPGARTCADGAWSGCEGAVVPAEERCDGRDEDCDGTTDESDPALCAACAVPGEVGACAEGATICAEGTLTCRPRPSAQPSETCDLRDEDCDGAVDEAGEALRPIEAAVLETCGAPDPAEPAFDPLAPIDADVPTCDVASLHGCGPVHACLDTACLDGCAAAIEADTAACAAGCGDDAACVLTCRAEAAATGRDCRAACPAGADGVTRWSCTPGNPCAPAVCADGWRLRGDRCVRPEICNNGLDDDGDGLVDGVVDPALFGPDTCMAEYETAGTETTLGGCPGNVADPRCDNYYVGADDPDACRGENCPRVAAFDYDFALDREEISIRAYHQCVVNGCCSAPNDPRYRLFLEQLEQGPVEPTPTDPARCAEPPYVDPREPPDGLADLPITALTWCETRDYCEWVGKRLPTEAEWEYAATGPVPDRRPYPWGTEGPIAGCFEEDCCRVEDVEGPPPAICGRVATCPDDTADASGYRRACFALLDHLTPQCVNAREQCFGCITGPGPTYSFEDGATPEGVVNLVGNAAEWVFDWATVQHDDVVTNPVGPGCSDPLLDLPSKMNRGVGYNAVSESGSYRRAVLPPFVRSRLIGGRCARTLRPDRAVCASGIPTNQQDACRPDGAPACGAPDFEDPRNSASCLGGQRVPLLDCDRGTQRFCSLDPLPCGSLPMTALRVDTESLSAQLQVLEQFLGFDAPEVPTFQGSSLVDDALNNDLRPNGGSTLLALELPCSAPGDGPKPIRLVNAEVADDDAGVPRVSELGVLEGGVCEPIDDVSAEISFVQRERMSNICIQAPGTLMLRGFAATIPYSGLMIYDTTVTEQPLNLRGNAVLFISDADLSRSTIGPSDGGIRALLSQTDIQTTTDFCFVEELNTAVGDLPAFLEGLLGPWDCSAFAEWPGCNNGVCEGVDLGNGEVDRSVCQGLVLPLAIGAVDEAALPLDQVPCENCR